jgi:hypothetical protein
MLNKDKITFGSMLISTALEFGGSLEDEGANEFEAELYDEYTANSEPVELQSWLREKVKDYFRYMDKPPRWVEDEPCWPFFMNKPMIFISQIELKNTPFNQDFLTWDEVIYLFGARRPFKKGYEMVYTTVSQLRGL